jgi:hypothetical protein
MKTLIDSTRFTVGFQMVRNVENAARCCVALFPKDTPDVTIQIIFDERENECYNVKFISVFNKTDTQSISIGFQNEAFGVIVLQSRTKHGISRDIFRAVSDTFMGLELNIDQGDHAQEVIRKVFGGKFGPRWSKLKAECDKLSADKSPYFYATF